MGDQHRYFPDWTGRSLANGPELEADDNSYFAGGYAEEFGYRARISHSRDVSELDGEVPEVYRERRGQATVHPGYPFRAHPIVDELDLLVRDQRLDTAVTGDRPSDRFTYERAAERQSRLIVVSNRERKRGRALPRAATASIRLAAALVSLRWVLRRAEQATAAVFRGRATSEWRR